MKIHNYPVYMFLVFFFTLVLVPSCGKETSIPTQTPSLLITKQYTPTLDKLQTKTTTPFPTDYPFPKRTILVALEQTRVVALQSPTPPPGGAIIGMGPPIQLGIPPGTPMGDGVLTDLAGMHMSQYMGSFSGNLLVWVTEIEDGKATLVYAGVDANDQEQGLLFVVREAPFGDPYGERIVLPNRSGKPTIVDAVGQRLIIETEDGNTFYFDVPSGMIAPSMDATLSTMTPGPTLTPRVTPTFPSGDDVTNKMYGSSRWPINKDLTFFINPGDDEDWFHFYLPSTSDIVISLRDLPAPYGLVWIYDSVVPAEFGVDENLSLNDKVFQIQGAEAGYYYVGVVALTDAFSSSNPYSLRFSTE